jgi:hypothetical protein
MGKIAKAILHVAQVSGAKVPNPDTVPAAAAEVVSGEAWILDTLFETKGTAGTGGYHFSRAVGEYLQLEQNAKGGYPQLRSTVRAALQGFDIGNPDGDLLRKQSALQTGDDVTMEGWVAILTATDAMPDNVQVPVEDAPEAPATPKRTRTKKASA